MTPTLTKIIEDWIGEGEEIPRRYALEFNDGYEEALSDLRSRVPELVAKIMVSNRQDSIHQIELMDYEITRHGLMPEVANKINEIIDVVNSLTSE